MKIDERRMMKLNKISEAETFGLYEYLPSFFEPLLLDFERMRLTRRIRYLLMYLKKSKYVVYYLCENDEAVAFCVVRSAEREIPGATDDDIILGPYYVEKSKRGKGYSKVLIREVLKYHPCYKNAFDWILKSNIPSIKASESCGFSAISDVNITGLLRIPTYVYEGGEYRMYKYERKDAVG